MSDKREEYDSKKGSGNSGNAHIKWFAIIMGILIFLLIVFLDYCTRRGDI